MSDEYLGSLTAGQRLPGSCEEKEHLVSWFAFPDVSLLAAGPESTCFPGKYSALTGQYYSAASCPYGYTPACSRTTTSSDTVTETIRTCCPTSFDYSCVTSIYLDQETNFGCLNPATSGSSSLWTLLENIDGTWIRTSSLLKEGGVYAYSVQIRSHSDTVATTTASTDPPTTTSPGTSETSTIGSDSSDNEPDDGSSAPSTGAVAGIAVGCAVAVVAIAAFIFLFARRQRRKRNDMGAQTPFLGAQDQPALQSSEVDNKYRQSQLSQPSQFSPPFQQSQFSPPFQQSQFSPPFQQSQFSPPQPSHFSQLSQPAELYAVHSPTELYAVHSPAELDAGQRDNR